MALVAGRGYSLLEKVKAGKKFGELSLDFWDDKGTAESDGRIALLQILCIRKMKDLEDTFKTSLLSLDPLPSVKRLQDSKLEKISEPDQLFTEDSKDKLLQLHDRPTEIITKSLNPMIKVANKKLRRHKKLLNRFYKCFDVCFEVDKKYFLHEELKEDYFFPEELLSEPDLDFEKLQELPFDFRTSLVTIRSLFQKVKDCHQKCRGQLNVILDVIQREIHAISMPDEACLSTPFHEELSKELEHMNLLLRQFSSYADCCNAQLEEILMDVVLISDDFLV